MLVHYQQDLKMMVFIFQLTSNSQIPCRDGLYAQNVSPDESGAFYHLDLPRSIVLRFLPL